jgi:hypothetical protein
LTFNGTGAGASRRSNTFVTMRNQNAAETSAGLNSLQRVMQADLVANIELGQDQDTYITFLVRENTGTLSAAQLASPNRKLDVDLLNTVGVSEFAFTLDGLQQKFGIDSKGALGAADTSTLGFTANTTYMFVGRISGSADGPATLSASLFAPGSVVADFTNPDFQWMLTTQGSSQLSISLSDLQIMSRAEANFTVSNVWIGSASAILPPTRTLQGDFNQDGIVDTRDYVAWQNSMGQTGTNLPADGNGNTVVDAGDLNVWRAHYGMTVTGAGAGAVPEPGVAALLVIVAAAASAARKQRC